MLKKIPEEGFPSLQINLSKLYANVLLYANKT
jgi:hypothetical protein